MYRRSIAATASAVSTSPTGRPPPSPAAVLQASATASAPASCSATPGASRSTRPAPSRSSGCVGPVYPCITPSRRRYTRFGTQTAHGPVSHTAYRGHAGSHRTTPHSAARPSVGLALSHVFPAPMHRRSMATTASAISTLPRGGPTRSRAAHEATATASERTPSSPRRTAWRSTRAARSPWSRCVPGLCSMYPLGSMHPTIPQTAHTLDCKRRP